jgi:hypothetical protein
MTDFEAEVMFYSPRSCSPADSCKMKGSSLDCLYSSRPAASKNRWNKPRGIFYSALPTVLAKRRRKLKIFESSASKKYYKHSQIIGFRCGLFGAFPVCPLELYLFPIVMRLASRNPTILLGFPSCRFGFPRSAVPSLHQLFEVITHTVGCKSPRICV